MNGKFTFGGLNVVPSVDGGMGRYSYIAQGMAWGYLRLMSLMYEYCVKMERMNGKFTFGGLNVVPSVDGGMGCYSYIAQGMAWD
ncbi:hypothetical protein MTR67_035348 [Solanum verrucosum]|uniref:Uncharacterized protein n=1 Tax=Solanum verrucosum TaxID=315347 RepID=A0AAF0U9D2_SOLVR|nr:hypothetical protein MTR67_035348 [Solanum verrucosum]